MFHLMHVSSKDAVRIILPWRGGALVSIRHRHNQEAIVASGERAEGSSGAMDRGAATFRHRSATATIVRVVFQYAYSPRARPSRWLAIGNHSAATFQPAVLCHRKQRRQT